MLLRLCFAFPFSKITSVEISRVGLREEQNENLTCETYLK